MQPESLERLASAQPPLPTLPTDSITVTGRENERRSSNSGDEAALQQQIIGKTRIQGIKKQNAMFSMHIE